MAVSVFSVREQMAFYGTYHNNPTNVLIHKCFVPVLLWSFQVMMASSPVPAFFPPVYVHVNDYLAFEVNWATVHAVSYILYYAVLDPVAAVLYTPQMTLSLFAAISFAARPSGLVTAIAINVGSWIAQFIGHYAAEGRSPLLMDNIVGALVLAPFFVHLELLFAVGYRPALHKAIKNTIGVELVKVKKAEAEKKRAKGL